MRTLLAVLCACCAMLGAERRAVAPANGAKVVGPYSPGLLAGNYLYVSGQGVRGPTGAVPATIEAQTRQCLENVKAIVEAAGLTMKDVVYTQVYVTDMKSLAAVNRVYATYFPGGGPARATIGVARMPTDTPVEISAVATRGATSDRLYLPGIQEGNAQSAVKRLQKALSGAGLNLQHLVALQVYHTPGTSVREITRLFGKGGPAVSVVEVASLPEGKSVELTGVAARDAQQKKVTARPDGTTLCAALGETIYCAVQQDASRSAMDEQVARTMETLNSGLRALGADLAHAVANNVYLDQIDEFAVMNAAYAKAFSAPPPTRTTVQPAAAVNRTGGQTPVLVRIGIVAVK